MARAFTDTVSPNSVSCNLYCKNWSAKRDHAKELNAKSVDSACNIFAVGGGAWLHERKSVRIIHKKERKTKKIMPFQQTESRKNQSTDLRGVFFPGNRALIVKGENSTCRVAYRESAVITGA